VLWIYRQWLAVNGRTKPLVLAWISQDSFLGKAMRLPLRLLPAGTVVPIVQGPARGKRWVSNAAANGYWLGFWEIENQRLFAAHLKKGDVVYDIGAHVGLYMLGASQKVGFEGHVYAFEPFERNAQYLRRHIELNRLPNCSVVEAAVCNSTGRRRFDASGCHSEARLSVSGSATVPTLSIDEFLSSESSRRQPDVIKVDAPGAEMEIFSGGQRTLAEFGPRIFLFSYYENENRRCRELLSSLGYSFEQLVSGVTWAEKRR
jgi:FkbM family methyltransferase